jgi:hypothetical protein
MGQHTNANAHMGEHSLIFIGRLPRGSWAILGRKLRRLLIDVPFVSSAHRQLSLSSP